MDKYLYFRSVADEDNDDGDGASSGINPTSLCIPVNLDNGKHIESAEESSSAKTAIVLKYK